MTKGEFTTVFHRLCKGLKFAPTVEQADAWYAKVLRYTSADWEATVETCLCAERFPRIEHVLDELDRRDEQRRRASVWKDRQAADRAATACTSGRPDALSPELFQTITVLTARHTVRRLMLAVAANVRAQRSPVQRETELARLRAEDARLTAEYGRLLVALPQGDADLFVTRYASRFPGEVAA